jgi:hypothetical protein
MYVRHGNRPRKEKEIPLKEKTLALKINKEKTFVGAIFLRYHILP